MKPSVPTYGVCGAHEVSIFQTTSTKSPPPTMATAILPPFTDGTVKNCRVSPTATTSWSITGTSATACTRFTRKFEKTVE